MNRKQLKAETYNIFKEGQQSSDKTDNEITEVGSTQPYGPTQVANRDQVNKRLCVRAEGDSDYEYVTGDCDLR